MQTFLVIILYLNRKWTQEWNTKRKIWIFVRSDIIIG